MSETTLICAACGRTLDRGWQGNTLDDKKYCSPECPSQPDLQTTDPRDAIDILERLRCHAGLRSLTGHIMGLAAAEIERLRAELEEGAAHEP